MSLMQVIKETRDNFEHDLKYGKISLSEQVNTAAYIQLLNNLINSQTTTVKALQRQAIDSALSELVFDHLEPHMKKLPGDLDDLMTETTNKILKVFQ